MPKRIPSTIPNKAITVDRDFGWANWAIQLELEFLRRLDVERLARSMDLILDAEPVLGCRWISHWRKPLWERLEKSERQAFELVYGQDEYEKFKSESIDSRIGPQLKACLWQSADRDCLLIKVCHDVADAGAVKEIAGAVSSIYCRLAQEPNYQPEPNIEGLRDIWQVMRHIPWHAYPGNYLEYWRQNWSVWRVGHSTYRLPLAHSQGETLGFAHRFFPADQVAYLIEYGRTHSATLNDVVMAAFIRALGLRGGCDGRSRLMASMTVDLRQRYLSSKRGEGEE